MNLSDLAGPLAQIGSLGVLVKWWMSSTERSIKSIADSMQKLAETVNAHASDIAVLQDGRAQHTAEIKFLWEALQKLRQ